jgi:hypothetical protein
MSLALTLKRRLLLHAAALLHSAGRRCDNCGLPLDCCCFWLGSGLGLG